jgi:radical SAM-linked protein
MTQRVRVTFAKEGPLRWVAHLDLMRTWERAIRRATLPLSYSQGFSPHAKIALAAPLPVGVEGTRELIDIWFDDSLSLDEVARRLTAVMPPGLSISSVEQVAEELPSMQSCLESARYEMRFAAGAVERADLEGAVARLLALDGLDWEEQRGQKVRRYDLRATVLALSTREEDDGTVVLEMHLSLEQGRTGRPSQVLKALGVEAEPAATIRTAIAFAEAAAPV